MHPFSALPMVMDTTPRVANSKGPAADLKAKPELGMRNKYKYGRLVVTVNSLVKAMSLLLLPLLASCLWSLCLFEGDTISMDSRGRQVHVQARVLAPLLFLPLVLCSR